MPEREYVTIAELASRLGLDRSNTRKYALKRGFAFFRVRTPESRNQLTLALTREDAEMVIESRKTQGYDTKKYSGTVLNGETSGYFYAVQIVPELDPKRVKLGFATDPETRLSAYKTVAPSAQIVKSWPCRKRWEETIIDSITRIGCSKIGVEVYLCEDIGELIKRAESIFSLMPIRLE